MLRGRPVAITAVLFGLILILGTAVGFVRAFSARRVRPSIQATGSVAAGHPSLTVPATVTTVPVPPPSTDSVGDRIMGDPKADFVRARNQVSDGAAVVVDEVVFSDGPGWIVIHQDLAGVPGVIIGHSQLIPVGTTTNVSVPLGQPLQASADVLVMLHHEDNGDTAFDFPSADLPVQVGGRPLMVPIAITLRRSTP